MDWLTSIDILPLEDLTIALTSISTSSAATSTAKAGNNINDIELLKTQVEFLQSQLGNSFNGFVTAMQVALGVFTVVFTVLGGLLVYIFGQNLNDAKRFASQVIQQEIDNHIAGLVKKEVKNVKQTLQRERVISSTIVDYYLSSSTGEPDEYKLLEARRFENVQFWNKIRNPRRFSGDVCVLDLENSTDSDGKKFSELSDDKREEAAKKIIDDFLKMPLPVDLVIVIYVAPPALKAINNAVFKDRYYAPANTAITLVGMVADAAYVANGLKNS